MPSTLRPATGLHEETSRLGFSTVSELCCCNIQCGFVASVVAYAQQRAAVKRHRVVLVSIDSTCLARV